MSPIGCAMVFGAMWPYLDKRAELWRMPCLSQCCVWFQWRCAMLNAPENRWFSTLLTQVIWLSFTGRWTDWFPLFTCTAVSVGNVTLKKVISYSYSLLVPKSNWVSNWINKSNSLPGKVTICVTVKKKVAICQRIWICF